MSKPGGKVEVRWGRELRGWNAKTRKRKTKATTKDKKEAPHGKCENIEQKQTQNVTKLWDFKEKHVKSNLQEKNKQKQTTVDDDDAYGKQKDSGGDDDDEDDDDDDGDDYDDDTYIVNGDDTGERCWLSC